MKVLWIVPCKINSSLDMLFARHGIDEYKNLDIEILQYDFNLRRSIFGILRELIQLREMCVKNHIDLVHAQFGSTTSLLAFLSGYPYIITFRGTDLNGDPSSYWIANKARKLLGQITSTFAREVILVSKTLERHLLKRNFHIIPSGTKTDLFKPINRLEAKKKLNLNFDTSYLAFATGGGRGLKRQDLAQQVVDMLNNKGCRVSLLPIWNVPHADVPYYLNSSDAVLLTSEREGSPNIVREALACGIPVCSFEVGDVKKWLAYDSMSTVVSQGDLEGLVSAVEKILCCKPTHERRVDVDLFSVTSSVEKTTKLYLHLKSSH